MRRAMTVTAFIAAAGLMTACGSGGGDDGGDGKKEHAGKSTATTSSKPASDGRDKTYEVSFEVGGKGRSNVYYNLDTNHFEQVTLPWKKSDKLTLNSTERKVGITVSVVPGPVLRSNGRMAAAPCSITVDGKKVTEDPGGADGKHKCEYTLR
ncbi:hypothetical protein ACFY93_25550 [Streptomyces sp. NPDC008313]|uniref:hypothetical protein n=1 Tax=Streptomyces sp. NPDC008313 TaxID=3364826 RepID=UPI0036E95888